jgi:hypothetical protein
MDRVERPRSLVLLSVLSFVGGFISIRNAIISLFFSDDKYGTDGEFNLTISADSEMPSFIQQSINGIIDYWLMVQEHQMLIQASALILSILSIIGVYWMYQLKKKGFFLYVGSNLLMVIIPLFFYYNNPIGELYIALLFFFTAMFIFLYASQLRYMKA